MTPDPLAAAVDLLCAEHTVRVDRDDAAVAELVVGLRAQAAMLAAGIDAEAAQEEPDRWRLGALRRRLVIISERSTAAGTGHAVQPSLLAALREAADPMGGVENDRPGSSVSIPINPDAVDLLQRLRRIVRDALAFAGLEPRADHGDADSIHGELRRLVVAHWPSLPGGPEYRDSLARRLSNPAAEGAPGVAERIRSLLDPDPQERSMRDAPCIACGATAVRVERDGEDVVVPALRADLSGGLLRGVECRACLHYIWRETDAQGEPTGAFADLRDWVAWHRDQAAFLAASRRAADRAEAEARYPIKEAA